MLWKRIEKHLRYRAFPLFIPPGIHAGGAFGEESFPSADSRRNRSVAFGYVYVSPPIASIIVVLQTMNMTSWVELT